MLTRPVQVPAANGRDRELGEIYPIGATFTCGILALVDGVMIFTDPNRMSLHDKIAKSQVIVVG